MSIIWLVILPLGTAFSLGLLHLYWEKGVGLVVFISSTVHLLLVGQAAVQAFRQPLVYKLGAWDSPLGIQLLVDNFAAFLLLVIAGLFYLIIIYSLQFMGRKSTKYYVLLLILLAGMMGMTMTSDLFNMYVFLEVISLATYGLVAINKRDYSFEGSFKYLIIGSLSGVFVLLAIILTYQGTGSLNLADLAGKFTTMPELMQTTILGLYLLGLGTKIALVPLHSWLPDAYTTALAPVSALSSALVIKVFLYNLVRLIYLLYGLEFLLTTNLQLLLVCWGTVTFLTAHFLAYQQTNLRRLLGYSSVAQMGYIMIGFGLGTELGVIAGNYHLLNHAVMKTALFLAAGIFTAATGAYSIKSLQGLGRKLPVISLGFTTAALAIIGLPPLNGFISKWLLIKSALEAEYQVVGLLIIVGTVLALGYYLKVIKLLYNFVGEEPEINFPTWQLKLPVVILGTACLGLGLFPQFPLSIIEKTVSLLAGSYAEFLLGG